MFDLSAIGFGPFFEQQITDSGTIPARIASEHRGSYDIWTCAGESTAQLSGRLARDLGEDAFPGVGDWVTLKTAIADNHTAIINRVLDRRTVFTRGAAGRDARSQVIAANVDLVFIVCGLDADYSLRRIERYLARVWASGAQPVIVLNKADLCENVEERIGEVGDICFGVPVMAVSALHGNQTELLRGHLKPGLTTAFVGSSGAGKSTLINSLLNESRMRTGEVRQSDQTGRHTTTHRQLIVLPRGGVLIDTPGMRELQMVDDKGLDTVFADIEGFAEHCRFRDCTHQTEPGCAVREAVAAGDLDPERLNHYRKLEAEARAYEIRHDKRRQRESDRAFGKMVRQVAALKDKSR